MTKPLRIVSVVGARPNFMKIAPFVRAIEAYNASRAAPAIEHRLVHTGQHYDFSMAGSFFAELGIPEPDVNLAIGSGSYATQVGSTLIAFEQYLADHPADVVVVVGDVNATVACALATKRTTAKLVHVEAGLRSFDQSMPEELNRIVTDRISDLLLTPDPLAVENLLGEGRPAEAVHHVGNIMIDTLDRELASAQQLEPAEILTDAVAEGKAANSDLPIMILTLHRPATVDDDAVFRPILDYILNDLADRHRIVWPVHPRVAKRLDGTDWWDMLWQHPNLLRTRPLRYRELLRLNLEAALCVTDSGGLQEECCVLGTPFVVIRPNTERPITLLQHGGCGVIAGHQPTAIDGAIKQLANAPTSGVRPLMWDGQAAPRVLECILALGGLELLLPCCLESH